MSLTTITISAVNYSAYASVAEADAFLAVDPLRAAAWAALTTDQKGANLVAATRRIDLESWDGAKTVDSQATQFPRTGLTCDGVSVASDSIPQRVEDASILIAGSIAISAQNAEAGSSGSNIKKAKAGSAEVTFFRPTSGVALQDETAFKLLKCFLGGSASFGFGIHSGASSDSTFDDVDYPGLVDGLY